MPITARSVTLIANGPDTDEREGAAMFRVEFDASSRHEAGNNLSLSFEVSTRKGLADALELARARLIDFIRELENDAVNGDLGHGPWRLF